VVGDEGEGGVVAGLGVGLVGGDEDGEVFSGASQATAYRMVLLPAWVRTRRGGVS
jgi:hypothetical protein